MYIRSISFSLRRHYFVSLFVFLLLVSMLDFGRISSLTTDPWSRKSWFRGKVVVDVGWHVCRVTKRWIEVRFQPSITSIFLYACESWTLTAKLQRRIQAMEMRCYHKILHISYKDHVTNEEVRAKNQQAIGPHETSWPLQRDTNCNGMVMSPVHHVWPKPSHKAQWKGEEDKADRGRGWKTT